MAVQDIMRDAVTAADGCSYERAALQTAKGAHSAVALPNRRLQALIDRLLHLHGFGSASRPGPRAECLLRRMGASRQAQQLLPQLCCPLTKVRVCLFPFDGVSAGAHRCGKLLPLLRRT